jgi:hypothetical protein
VYLFVDHGHVHTLVDMRGHAWTIVGHAWTCVDMRGHSWPFVDMKTYGQHWTFSWTFSWSNGHLHGHFCGQMDIFVDNGHYLGQMEAKLMITIQRLCCLLHWPVASMH